MGEVKVLKAKKDTDVRKLAGAIANNIEKDIETEVVIISVGAAANNQSIKAIATANQFLDKNNIEICSYPVYENVKAGNKEITAIKHRIVARRK